MNTVDQYLKDLIKYIDDGDNNNVAPRGIDNFFCRLVNKDTEKRDKIVQYKV